MSSTHSTSLTFWAFIWGKILSFYARKSLGQYLTKMFRFVEGQYLDQINIQILTQVGCVDAPLSWTKTG